MILRLLDAGKHALRLCGAIALGEHSCIAAVGCKDLVIEIADSRKIIAAGTDADETDRRVSDQHPAKAAEPRALAQLVRARPALTDHVDGWLLERRVQRCDQIVDRIVEPRVAEREHVDRFAAVEQTRAVVPVDVPHAFEAPRKLVGRALAMRVRAAIGRGRAAPLPGTAAPGPSNPGNTGCACATRSRNA